MIMLKTKLSGNYMCADFMTRPLPEDSPFVDKRVDTSCGVAGRDTPF